MTPRAALPYRLYVLLVWLPICGMALYPVGVLGLDERPVAIPKTYVSWVPLTFELAQPWRDRLAQPPTPSMIAVWLDESGGAQLSEIDTPGHAHTLGEAVEAALDRLLSEVFPMLPPLEP